ncbi:hypothetical protein F4678DRAFT_419827 [Xylaria arbuscula]|nr:hypothetical protein F4678DRAFT_419827 [Xylaria arbuscula]
MIGLLSYTAIWYTVLFYSHSFLVAFPFPSLLCLMDTHSPLCFPIFSSLRGQVFIDSSSAILHLSRYCSLFNASGSTLVLEHGDAG